MKETFFTIYEMGVNNENQQKVLDLSSLNTTFDYPLTIGVSLDANKDPHRYFIGKLSNIKILFYK